MRCLGNISNHKNIHHLKEILRMKKLQKAKKYILLFLCLVSVLFFFRKELKLLFIPDPEKEVIYKYSFHDSHIKYAKNIVQIEGFVTEKQGFQLSPGTIDQIIFSFHKKTCQGCLLHVWFYGDEGKERTNAIKNSIDAERTYNAHTGYLVADMLYIG